MQAIRVATASGDETSSPHSGETPTDYSHATLAGCVATRGHAARGHPRLDRFRSDAGVNLRGRGSSFARLD